MSSIFNSPPSLFPESFGSEGTLENDAFGNLFGEDDFGALSSADLAEDMFGAEGDLDALFAEEDGTDLLLQHYGEDLGDMEFFGTEPIEVEAPAAMEAPLQGRIAMARRVRREAAPGLLQAGYVKGVQDALVHFGLVDPALHARMGLLWGEAAAGTPITLPDSFGALPAGKKTSLFDPNGSIEADASELPPVYVADTTGVRACLSSGRAKDASASFALEDRFGDAALAGFVGTQRRAGSRRAAERALSSASSQSAPSSGHGAAFVEDVEAAPHLFSDGTILDPVYGKLRLTPCPSCSVCSAEDVKAGHAQHCGLCDGHGAVLIPQEDASMWSGIRYGSLVPLVLGVGAEVVDGLLGSSAASSVSRPVKRRRPAFTWSTPEAGEGEDVARAVVPDRWLSST
jgi:hypothetical protein